MTSPVPASVVTHPLPTPKLITIAVLAMGGEGGGVLSDWIVDLAEHSGYFAQSTSVPGVAQRTGATIYYVEIFPKILAGDGQQPVLALMPVPGEVDIVIASELMEAGRAIQRGFVTPDRTTLVASTHRVYSMTERTAMADGRADSEVFEAAAQESAKRLVRADFAKLAEKAGSIISATLFGGLAGTGAMPFSREQFESAIRRGGKGIEPSLRAFAAGFDSANAGGIASPVPEIPIVDTRVGPALVEAAKRIKEEFPIESHEILFPSVRRLAEYQDVPYAEQFLDSLVPILEIERLHGGGNYILLRETARYLALWSSYEDAVRVADLKTRSKRFERVQRDSHADAAQLVEINEFLSPQPQELADLLPVRLGEWLMSSEGMKRFITRFTDGGKVVETSSITGFLVLYFVARLRFLRRGSLRFHVEHKRILEWLAAIRAIAGRDYATAVEIAECGQLIKGYAGTHALGTRNFDCILAVLPAIEEKPDAHEYVRRLRIAALADDTGKELSRAASAISQ